MGNNLEKTVIRTCTCSSHFFRQDDPDRKKQPSFLFSGHNGRPLITETTSIDSLQITGNIRNENDPIIVNIKYLKFWEKNGSYFTSLLLCITEWNDSP